MFVFALGNDQRAAVIEGRKNLQYRNVKTDAGELEDDRVLAHVEVIGQAHGLHIAVQGSVGLGNTLGLSGGPGSVNHVRLGYATAQNRKGIHLWKG